MPRTPAAQPATAPSTVVAIATAEHAWPLDEDGPLLIDALTRAGLSGRPMNWNDPNAPWSEAEVVIIRSTWDYVDHHEQFLAWADRVGERLHNPASVVRWNTDKRYLADLAAAGVPTVPTRYIGPDAAPGSDWRVAGAVAGLTDGDVVVKPAVSAGSRDTARYRHDDPGIDAHIGRLTAAGRTAMVQPYLDAVDRDGETGLLFFDGRFSHAFRKGPLLRNGPAEVDGLFAREQIDPRTPTAGQLAVAEATIDAVTARLGVTPLYARIDLLGSATGEVVLEVELTEPSFFLGTDPDAADRFVDALTRRLRRRSAVTSD